MNALRRAITVAIVAVVTLAACGTTGSQISAAERARLGPFVDRIRAAAERHDRPATRRSLSDLRHAVAVDEGRSELSSTDAAEILAAAAHVESQLELIPGPTTTTTTTVPADTGDQKHDRGKGNKNRRDEGGGGND